MDPINATETTTTATVAQDETLSNTVNESQAADGIVTDTANQKAEHALNNSLNIDDSEVFLTQRAGKLLNESE